MVDPSNVIVVPVILLLSLESTITILSPFAIAYVAVIAPVFVMFP